MTESYNKLYISLDGIYNQINLNTLRAPSGKFLLDTRDIYYVMNTKEVPSVKNKERKFTGAGKQAVLFGNPNYAKGFNWDQMKKMPLPELPDTKTEVEDIAKLLKTKAWKPVVYTRDDATEKKVKELQSPFILHIATHGFFLNAYESMFLNLEKTNLVVLSACETGLGEIRDGEGVYGLQRAFQIAGTSTLMISLWQVSDEVTQKLMSLFYRNWLISGDKVQAFRRAQEEIKKQYPAPFYWGPFVLINN